jgi:hypothetical protein
MPEEKKDSISNRVFAIFSEKFRYSIALFLVVLLQFMAVEILIAIRIVQIQKMDMLTYAILHGLLIFSSAFHGCSHVACRSYVTCKTLQLPGTSKYQSRAAINFFAALVLFLLALFSLIFMNYLGTTSI